MLQKKQIFIVLLFNIIIAFGFYTYHSNAVVTDISSDLANIIPICAKLDNQNLFKNDLYLNDINNVKYYTPFYIETLRFLAKFTNYNYIQALNLLSLIIHFLYGIIWFYFLFLLRKDFWLAFGFSIFMRGIIWPPGMELLGISELWTIMPRTVFIALIPLPFIIYKLNSKRYLIISALTLGLLVNFHPISGVGAIIIYLSLFLVNNYYQNSHFSKSSYKEYILIILCVFTGMLPFLLSYVLHVKSASIIDQVLFQEAIRYRIDAVFFDGFLFLKTWHRPVFYFFLLCFICFYFFDTSIKKINFKAIAFSIFVLLLFSNGITFIENYINHQFNMNFRFAFQLIRAQKLIIVMMQVSLFLLLFELAKKYSISNRIKVFGIFFYVLLLTFSTAPIVNKIPLIGEDISTYILPNSFKIFPQAKKDNINILEVFDYVNENTKNDAVFYCENVFFRTATNRSEILDSHAAGMLIEGNQEDYLKAYLNLKAFNNYSNEEKIQFLKSKKVDYIIDSKGWNNLVLVYKNAEYFIYKL